MKHMGVLMVVLAVIGTATLSAQTKKAASDPISGKWTGTPSEVVFELKYDGKKTVTGRVTPHPGDVAGTYDAKTGALKLAGDTVSPRGQKCHFVIDGKVEKGTVAGTATCGTEKVGDFSLTRK